MDTVRKPLLIKKIDDVIVGVVAGYIVMWKSQAFFLQDGVNPEVSLSHTSLVR